MSLHLYTCEVEAYLRQSWYCGIASNFVLDHFNLIDLDFVARVPDTRALLRFNERHVFPSYTTITLHCISVLTEHTIMLYYLSYSSWDRRYRTVVGFTTTYANMMKEAITW
jgi:hypothetical protein